MFNCYGEPVDLAQLNSWPLASVSQAGMIDCHDELEDLAQQGESPSAVASKADHSAKAEASALEGERQPWWYRLLVPSDSGTVASLGQYATASVTAGAGDAADTQGEEAATLQALEVALAKEKISTKIDLECAVVVGKSMSDWEPENENTSTKIDLECATVVGKSMLDWEPEPEVPTSAA
eukprot:CAMPEP_0115448408 /NCGR_PEP_ID=MMETSP0271-20121206/40473_1 /TAXON_ID=71861 /ORGANISM="Scrippsiella trochoidea, Strain CCMP3099" /LENGTH=179 /DNA_ID=CAMNT_0002874523 /DNA_START=26 /DNA_END=565 /DNA_ORIENTATION=-